MFEYGWIWLSLFSYIASGVLLFKVMARWPVPAETVESPGREEGFKNDAVPLQEIVFGIFLPFLIIAVSGLIRLFFLETRPWSQGDIKFFMLTFFNLVLFFYAIIVCKKRGLWPLFRPAARAERLSMLFSSLLIAVGVNFMVGATHLLLQKVFNRKLEMPDYSALATFGPNSLLSIVIIVIGFTAIPVLEEIYFRGFLYNALKTRYPRRFAATLQSVLFAAAHGAGWIVGILYFLAGMALTAVYEMKKDLTFPVWVHGFINSLALVPLLIVTLQNFHMPASTWEEARSAPSWMIASPPAWIEKKEDGMKQRQHAIDTWGSEGSKAWKKEVNGFNAVCFWFPEDRAACAKARVGVIAIYLHQLKDYRRTVVEADRLISEFPELGEEKGAALSSRGYAYLLLQDLEKARQSFEKVIHDLSQYEKPREEAEQGIEWLERIGSG